MSDITPEQRAAWAAINDDVRAGWHNGKNFAVLADLLPAELTNPQPELPTEPGWYTLFASDQTHMGTWHTDHQEMYYLNSEGSWVDVGWGEPSPRESRPFTRLVPVRPTITLLEIASAYQDVTGDSMIDEGIQAIFVLVNSKGGES